jgi:hypothetical protein
MGAGDQIFLVFCVVWIVSTLWMAWDAKRRGDAPGIWFFSGVLAWPIILPLYLLHRRKPLPLQQMLDELQAVSRPLGKKTA